MYPSISFKHKILQFFHQYLTYLDEKRAQVFCNRPFERKGPIHNLFVEEYFNRKAPLAIRHSLFFEDTM